jgi:hypothetical protein
MVKTLVPICPNGLVGKLGQWYLSERAWGLGTKYTKMNQFLWIWTGQWLGLIALFPNPSLHTWLPSLTVSHSLNIWSPNHWFFFWLANFSHCGYGNKYWKIRHILREKKEKKSQVSPYLDNEFLLLVVRTRQDSLIVWPLAKVGLILLWIQLLSGFSIHPSTFEGKV